MEHDRRDLILRALRAARWMKATGEKLEAEVLEGIDNVVPFIETPIDEDAVSMLDDIETLRETMREVFP